MFNPHRTRRRRTSRTSWLAAVGAVAALFVAACGSSTPASPTESGGESEGAVSESTGATSESPGATAEDSSEGESPMTTETPADSTVTLVTHDSFAVSPEVLDAFEAQSGITIQVLAQGDAGEVLSKLIVTQGNPLGDVVFGIDNTFATKALNADILAPYLSPLADRGSDTYSIDPENRLTAVDFGDVCVNVDHEYFAEYQLAEPQTFEDLAKPEFRDLLVVEDAATSSPGLAFLLGTIAHFGVDGWHAYWQSLVDNGLKVASGWTDAYYVDFSGSDGDGDRPLVVSYASSPPSEVPEGSDEAPTGALLETCYRQVEYAGVLAGTAQPEAAQQVIDFLLSTDFQAEIPGTMWMYPVDTTVPLPDDWAKFAPVASDPASVDPAEIDAHRQQWIDEFTDIVHG